MNAYIKITILVLTWVMFNPKAVAQTNRNVVWVHGYNDDRTFWQGYAALFQGERRMVSNNRDYRTTNGNGIPELANQINAGITNPGNTVLVGHSMGGVAAAEIDRRRGGVRGIITVGAPLDGAAIANAVADGRVENEVRYAIKELQAGPKAQFFIGYLVYNLWTGRKLGEIIESGIVDVIGLDRYLNDDALTDLQEGQGYMGQANRYRAATPKISIWGNEESPVHYRLASSAVTNGQNDTKIVNVTAAAAAVYLSFQRKNEAAGVIGVAGGALLLNPKAVAVGAYALWTASQWKRGKDYLNNSERTWKNLIRATRTETTTFQVYEYICQPDVYIPWDEDYYAADADCWEWRTRTISTYIMEPSDGLLHRSTQEGARAANWNPTPVEARGVNHLEMGTHIRTEQILRDTWNGQYGAQDGPNSPFYIQPRN